MDRPMMSCWTRSCMLPELTRTRDAQDLSSFCRDGINLVGLPAPELEDHDGLEGVSVGVDRDLAACAGEVLGGGQRVADGLGVGAAGALDGVDQDACGVVTTDAHGVGDFG